MEGRDRGYVPLRFLRGQRGQIQCSQVHHPPPFKTPCPPPSINRYLLPRSAPHFLYPSPRPPTFSLPRPLPLPLPCTPFPLPPSTPPRPPSLPPAPPPFDRSAAVSPSKSLKKTPRRVFSAQALRLSLLAGVGQATLSSEGSESNGAQAGEGVEWKGNSSKDGKRVVGEE